MCKFHKDIARAIATHPETAEFHPGYYAVALVAMHPRLEEYIPQMFGCDGFVPAQMAGDDVQAYLEQSEPLKHYVFHKDGSTKTLNEIQREEEQYRKDTLGTLRSAIIQIAQTHDLSEDGLKFPDYEKHVADGFKTNETASPDPRMNGPFLDVAVVHCYEGYRQEQVPMGLFGETWDGKTEYFADRPLTIRSDAPAQNNPEIRGYDLAPIIAAVRNYHRIEGVREVIERMFCHAVSRIFRQAPDDVEKGIGFNESYGCSMCGSAGKAFQKGFRNVEIVE